MGAFKLGTMTLKGLFTKPDTVMYPAQTKEQPEGLKGHVEVEINMCNFCGICSKRCPAFCIEVDKKNGTWAVDHFRCVQCGACVRECPEHGITMIPTYCAPSTTKGVEVFTKQED